MVYTDKLYKGSGSVLGQFWVSSDPQVIRLGRVSFFSIYRETDLLTLQNLTLFLDKKISL